MRKTLNATGSTVASSQNMRYLYDGYKPNAAMETSSNNSPTRYTHDADRTDEVTLFVCYVPYGETLVDEHTTSYENPLKFSDKEPDKITGLYDHGTRSRNPRVTMWLNIDPLFEQFADMSPYAYCHGNPMKLCDPTGLFDSESEATNYMKWNGINGVVEKEGELYYINDYKNKTAYFRDPSLSEEGGEIIGQEIENK